MNALFELNRSMHRLFIARTSDRVRSTAAAAAAAVAVAAAVGLSVPIERSPRVV